MNWNDHSNLEGCHAFMSASKFHWINYDADKIRTSYLNYLGVEKGTRLHALASELIKLKVKLPRTKNTLNMFVNDALGYKMQSEQVLYYSINCFGTADAISFKHNFLRIHDLKTGVGPTHMEQLMVYAALFCLEYNVKPETIDMELRIYQNDEVRIENPEPEKIREIMDKIIEFDMVLDKLKEDM